MNIVFNVKNNIWKSKWEGKTLEVTPVGNNYKIKLGSDIIHDGADIIGLLDILKDITGKTPLFKTENSESQLLH
tara:strand:+ start:441 stop:662 length:222 start_codon:yes stop_codon:yes gene_type:complete